MVGSTWQLLLAMKGPFVAEEDKGKASSFVKDASSTQTYSFLPASWVGNTHCYSSFSSSFRLAILPHSMSTYLER